ncbi:Surfeit locus protein 1 [Morus notabilis]|uniref:SURF1-like protein n=1 Tax=Morus notabilis TaxID=981085 RepID=W9QJ76_9ROSA|nr:Surfeit locus protein 1 [Morus notabilis]
MVAPYILHPQSSTLPPQLNLTQRPLSNLPVKMLEYRQKRLGMEPLNCNTLLEPNEELDSLEFRKVICRGVLDENKSIFVGPRSRSISGVTENGYYVITPLLPIPNDQDSVQSPILVNRGWVPRTWKDKALEVARDAEQSSKQETHIVEESERSSWWKFWTKKPKTIEDHVQVVSPVEVIGIVRGSEKPSIFVPPNEPSSNQWFYVDIPAIARTCGLPEATIYIEDINENVNPSNPYPLPKDVNTLIRSSVMPQDHLNYTLTWYASFSFGILA